MVTGPYPQFHDICAALGKPVSKQLLTAVRQEFPIHEGWSGKVHDDALAKHSPQGGARGIGSGFRNLEPSRRPYQACSRARLGSARLSLSGLRGLGALP